MKKILSKLVLLYLAISLTSACKSDDNNLADPTIANKQTLGTSAVDLLSSVEFKSLTLEFVYSEGFGPEPGTINSLLTFLEERVNKPQGITVVENVIATPTGAPFNIEKIRAIEDANRTIYNDGENLAVYIFLSNGKSSNDTPTKVTLGSAYRNTSIVIYKKTIQDIAISNNFNISLAEKTTLQHEFGHLFSLVNIQLDDIHQVHEDTQNNKHCQVEDCLMYFETTTGRSAIVKMFQNKSSVVRQLDSLCIEDLVAKGGKE
ncbi:MAG: membrane metalloprotease [Flavobacteriales bacterium]|jgi:hypothetical protein|nr:membrane metalloprotease [Flavobacteriales bacterium]